MKKVLMILLMSLSACSLFQPNEKVRFKNPIFYQRMSNSSTRQPFDLLLTPTTEQDFFHDSMKVLDTQSCELLENTENRIVQKCLHKNENDEPLYIYLRYTVATFAGLLEDDTCLIIEEDSRSPNFERVNGSSGYIVSKENLPNHDCGSTRIFNNFTGKWED